MDFAIGDSVLDSLLYLRKKLKNLDHLSSSKADAMIQVLRELQIEASYSSLLVISSYILKQEENIEHIIPSLGVPLPFSLKIPQVA